MASNEFADKTALVTGAARGIGLSVAREYAARGANCVLIDVSDEVEKSAEKMKADFPEAGVLALKADVSEGEGCENALRRTLENFPGVDFLVNNAGITRDDLLIRMSEKNFDDVIRVNLRSAFLMSRAAARKMIKQRSGRIVNVASVVGQMGNAGQVNYSASKAGIIGLTKSLARELASRNILVNAVAPGFIDTQMTRSMKEETKRALLDMIPLKRLGEPRDVANAVMFLSGGGASYITGHVLAINGGIYI